MHTEFSKAIKEMNETNCVSFFSWFNCSKSLFIKPMWEWRCV